MCRLFLTNLILLFSISALGSGMPVVDGLRAFESIKDATAAVTAMSELAHEFTENLVMVEEVVEFTAMIEETKQLLKDLKTLQDHGQYLAEYDVNRYSILAQKIKSITDVVRRVKAISLAISKAPSTQSVSLMVQMIRNERERLDRRFRTKFMMAKIKYEARVNQRKIRASIARRKRLLDSLNESEKKKYEWAVDVY